MKALAFAFTLAAAVVLPNAAGAEVVRFAAFLDGPSEFPSNLSPGTGYASVVWDTTAHTMLVQATFQDLTGLTTASHIHAPVTTPGGTAGVATQTPSFIGFPLGVSAGSFSRFYDTDVASTYRAGFITANGGTVAGAEAALFAALNDGTSYFNIHTTTFGGGEIRGFLQVAPVPEPATWGLMILGFGAAGAALRRRRTAVA